MKLTRRYTDLMGNLQDERFEHFISDLRSPNTPLVRKSTVLYHPEQPHNARIFLFTHIYNTDWNSSPLNVDILKENKYVG